ncbi:hypothetical protein C0991_003167 [Blastosporella zonata]|nr:hypothetical protein C0991_003167 [Blastosporella zonata]
MASGDEANSYLTDNIPPDSQLTDPNGLVVLGHLGSTGGLNLDLDNPLAQNFKLRAGEVQITVPSVPPRDDYIIVLFGDSGNSSPAFAITRITGGSNSTTSASAGSTTAIVTFSQTTTAHSSSRLSSTTLALDVTKSTTITSSATSTTSSTSTTAITTPQSTATTPTSLSSLPASSTTAANAVTTSNSAASSGARTTLASLGVASLLITLLV